ncbi:MAG: hypothetical protein WBB43_17725 [Limnoraphis sp.]
MAVKKSKGLGSNPLSSGIFSKTDSTEEPPEVELKSQESRVESQESKLKIHQESRELELSKESQESRVKSVESRFLNREQAELKGTNVRLPIELIDWVDDLVKQGSRDKNKSRIPKEVWFQAALELFQAMPVDWDDISDEDELKDKLKSLQSIIKSL